MENPKKKAIIGILGGIGSGKSTVAALFGELGCAVIDADKIAHELLMVAEIKEKVVILFGDGILDKTGQIDRSKLGQIVFSDSLKLSELNNILHPPVLARIEQLIIEHKSQSFVKAIVLDISLLAEIGWDKRCDFLIFVDCDEQIRTDRAKKTGDFDEKHLKIRENFQISLDNKEKLSDNIMDNNSDFEALIKRVDDVFSYIMSDS